MFRDTPAQVWATDCHGRAGEELRNAGTALVRNLKLHNRPPRPLPEVPARGAAPPLPLSPCTGLLSRSAPPAPEAAGQPARRPRNRPAPGPLPLGRGPAAGHPRAPRSPRGRRNAHLPPAAAAHLAGRARAEPQPPPVPAPPRESGPATGAGHPDWLRRFCARFSTGSVRTPSQ